MTIHLSEYQIKSCMKLYELIKFYFKVKPEKNDK